MLTASRIGWFGIAFLFALPSMVLIFRESGQVSQSAWIKSILFAGSIAMIIAIVFGRGKA